MSWLAVATIGGGALAGYLTGESQKGAAETAAGVQLEASQAGIEEQRRQFDQMRELLSPFIKSGESALSQQMGLIGLGGDEAQQQIIAQLEGSPQFQAMTRQGEEAILQSASATGGLRGGNVQSALAQFRPQVLSQLIEQRYGQLGGIAGLGQASAAGVGAAGLQTGGNIANLLQQGGLVQGGAALAGSRPFTGALMGAFTGLGAYGGLQGGAGMGAGPVGTVPTVPTVPTIF